MEKKLSRLIGLKIEDFEELVLLKQIKLRRANLIPTSKFGDEMALTSVLLSSICLIREFKSQILTDLKISKGAKILTFTEVEFIDFPDCRFDGLLLSVQSGVIKDAAIFEMKNGSSLLEKSQIERYSDIARKYSIPRIVTVSNEFVSEPTQSPLEIKPSRGLDLYHLSWSYILTIAHLLLSKKGTSIADEDQVEIMREVVHYFEADKSGVCGFNQMKAGWTRTVESIHAGTTLRSDDPSLIEAVVSWQQEERDIALMMSRKLGILVHSGEARFRGKYFERLDTDTKELVSKKYLESTFNVFGAVSEIKMRGLFEKRSIEFSVMLKFPKEKTLKGQVGWLARQFDNCKKREEADYDEISSELVIELSIKNTSKPIRIPLNKLSSVGDELKGKELKECRIIQVKDYGKTFSSRAKFVELTESAMLGFYKGLVQNLKKWESSAPKLNVKSSDEAAVVISDALPDLPENVESDSHHAKACEEDEDLEKNKDVA